MAYQETIAQVRRALDDIFSQVDRWFDEPAEVLFFRPAQGWSIAEVLEHLSLTNLFLMKTLSKWTSIAEKRAARGDTFPQGESNLEPIEVIGERGSFGWPHPEHMTPTGTADLGEVRKLLAEQLQTCQEILDRLPRGVGALCTINMSVNSLGRLDLYQWTYFLAQHARRHLQQLEAIKQEYRQVSGNA